MLAISYQNVVKVYGDENHPAVAGVSLDIEEGELVVLLGPSGCGKTTLLKMTNRLIQPTSGLITVNGRDVRSVNANALRRDIGYVIQQVGLFPHLSVRANVGTVPRLLGWPRKKIRNRTYEMLELVGLDPAQYAKRYPHELSGGQQQRVGLARALAADPAILLMDEPFGAIDAITRNRLQESLLEIQRRVRKTIAFVTHDVDEALRLGDRLVVMNEGQVVQYDAPVEVLTNPADDFVRQLLNSDDVLRELGVISVRSIMTAGPRHAGSPHVRQDQPVREALSLMLSSGSDTLTVLDESGAVTGAVTMEAVRAAGARGRREEPAVAVASG
jgi:osmoprotectant transport system ATP-binding protein